MSNDQLDLTGFINRTYNTWRPSTQADLAPAGAKAKARANLVALTTLREIRSSGTVTDDQRRDLARWAGWGALPNIFDEADTTWAPERAELHHLLDDKAWAAAARTTLNAHYTPANVASAMWRTVAALGFGGGKVLEPGCGSGIFIGLVPDDLDVDAVGVELDPTTAAIAQALYPGAQIRSEGFSTTTFPLGFFDLAIGNVPFGKLTLNDPRFNKRRHSIHNHFIIKSLKLVREGGLVAVLTSRYTMDARNPLARHDMADLGDLLGAVRFPAGAFAAAAGTQAIIDMLILRRTDSPTNGESWAGLDTINVGGVDLAVNSYFATHLDQVLGTIGVGRGMYRDNELTVTAGDDPLDDAMECALNAILVANGSSASVSRPNPRPAPVIAPAPARKATPLPKGRAKATHGPRDGAMAVPAAPRKEGSIVADGRGFAQVVDGQLVAYTPTPASDAAELRRLIALRDTLVALLDIQTEANADEVAIAALQEALTTRWEAYVAAHGCLNRFTVTRTGRVDDKGEPKLSRRRPSMGGFRLNDPDYPSLVALEVFDPDSQTATPAAVFSKRVVAPRRRRDSATSATDALGLCLDTYGEVRIEAIVDLLNLADADAARAALGDLVYDDPDTGDLIPAAVYLSGNVRAKIAAAHLAATNNDAFARNVAALTAVIPPELGPAEIDARLGASWIGADDVADFAREVLGVRQITIEHAPSTALWAVTLASWERKTVAMRSEWGTGRMDGGHILVDSLNQKPSSVYDVVDKPDGGTTRKLNPEDTLAAREKQEALETRFSEWVWEDHDRATRLAALYNHRFNSTVVPNFDGSHLTFPGLAAGFTPHPHQKNSVWRMLCSPTVLLGQPVGSGKTFIMCAGALELRRLGMVRLPVIVTPNHMLEQVTGECLQMFPKAKVLMATKEMVTKERRKAFVARCATGDWDMVIMTASAFERIPVSPATRARFIATKIAELRQAIGESADIGAKTTVKKMEMAVAKLEERHGRLLAEEHKDDGVTFEATGIDYILGDEAQRWKNMPFPTHIAGVGGQGSQRAEHMECVLNLLRQRHGARVATFATATPVSNTLAEIYSMQRYLAPMALKAAGIFPFDAWAAQFGKTVHALELSPDGSSWRIGSRFAKFRNVPELMAMFRLFADIRTPEELKLPTPELEGGQAEVVVVDNTPNLRAYMAELVRRAERVRSRRVEPDEDNMLKVCGDGRKAALHLNLVGEEVDGATKVGVVAERIATVYSDTRGHTYRDSAGDPHPRTGAFQLVFCDIGTPHEGRWSVYEDLRDRLVGHGIPEHQVRFIHEAADDRAKADLFAACRDGRVAVLIGSSEKMGVGTNIQARLIALHHVDCPWRPADIEQREGRGMRQGNQNKVLSIVRYVTEASFDVYMWQCNARKAAFIYQIMSGHYTGREVDDVGDTSLSFAEVKALATGNPLLLEAAGVDTEVARLTKAARAHDRDQTRLYRGMDTSREQAAMAERTVAMYDSAIARRSDTHGEAFTMDVADAAFTERAKAGEALMVVLGDPMHTRMASTGTGHKATIGSIGGFDVVATWTRNYSYGIEIAVGLVGLPQQAMVDRGANGVGVVSRLEHMLNRLEERRDEAATAHAHALSEVTAAEDRIGRPFSQAAELARLVARQAEIAATLAEMAEAQQRDEAA